MPKPIPMAQKLSILADAIGTTAKDAAKRGHVSASVVYQWADEMGGLGALRILHETKQRGAIADMVVAITEEGRRRLLKLGEANLTQLLIETLRASAARHVEGGTTVHVNANAQAASLTASGLSAAEAAYIAALAGEPSTAGGPQPGVPALPISGNGASGPEPAADRG